MNFARDSMQSGDGGERTGFWRTTEVAYLREAYPTLGPQHVSDALGRGLRAVYEKARRLGVRRYSPTLVKKMGAAK